jgi:protein involved in sex pheromone biosynthesis
LSKRLLRLATRIRDELVELDRVVARVVEGWDRALTNADDYYLDGVALNLHGFYGGLERIFELIATAIDGAKPKGENWYQMLLRQMTTEAAGLRPAVISQSTYDHLDDYRGFRHVVRNMYTYNFETAKLQNLVIDLPSTLDQARAELLAFASFLEHQGQD